jgi:type IV pilus assembly protein PilY1
MVNAATGALITKIPTMLDLAGSTAAGSTSDPSGLARLNSWVDSELVNQSKRFYGGDLKGNLWRFDIDALVEPFGRALLLGELKDADGLAQPITVKPALAEVDYNGSKYPVAFVATGRYLGFSDLGNTQTNSMYAIKDPLTNAQYGNLRARPDIVNQTITAGTDTAGQPTRSSTNLPVNWLVKAGWRSDYPAGGERVSVNPQLALETLYVGTNLPSSDACTVGGSSFLYQYNIATGASTATYVGSVMIQGLTLVQLTQGAAAGSVVTIITRSDGTLQAQVGSPSSSSANLRRTSWRELVE